MAAGVLFASASSASAAPPRASAPDARPALATGVSRDGVASWRLEGRSLTVRLRSPLFAASGDRDASLLARCGDGVAEKWEIDSDTRVPFVRLPRFADQGGRRTTVGARSRTVSMRLSRDVSAQATYCGFEATRAAGAKARFVGAWMTLRRGDATPCRPRRQETIAFQSATALVVKRLDENQSTFSSASLRGCMRPSGPMVAVGREWAGGGGGGGGSEELSGFRSAGRWLAWSSTYHPNNSEREGVAAVRLIDLGAGASTARAVNFVAGRAVGIYPTAEVQALASRGVVVWITTTRSPGAEPDYLRDSVLVAGRPDGTTIELARVGPGASIADVALTPDGRTVTWTAGGIAGKASL